MTPPLSKEAEGIIHGDCVEKLKILATDSIDCIITDPPYGYSFMGKDWDKAVPSVEIWRECLRVLKPGGFCCVMSAPRSDVQCAMISRLQEAGFRLDFTPIYWTYASGFPKATNIGKMVDKRLGADRKVIGRKPGERYKYEFNHGFDTGDTNSKFGAGDAGVLTDPATEQAKALDGSYAGFQPKPAVEVIIIAMKPLNEKTFVDQALANGKGISWLDDGRVPGAPPAVTGQGIKTKAWREREDRSDIATETKTFEQPFGRFPANLLVSDDILNDGRTIKAGGTVSGNEPSRPTKAIYGEYNRRTPYLSPGDSGSYSRYFDLDKWTQTLPFLIVPKASKSEKNKGLDQMPDKLKLTQMRSANGTGDKNFTGGFPDTITKNHHPTVKPLKLMSYLITLFSRPGDLVLDPFVGSGTTCVAAKQLNRRYLGIEREAEYVQIAQARLVAAEAQMELLDAAQLAKLQEEA